MVRKNGGHRRSFDKFYMYSVVWKAKKWPQLGLATIEPGKVRVGAGKPAASLGHVTHREVTIYATTVRRLTDNLRKCVIYGTSHAAHLASGARPRPRT